MAEHVAPGAPMEARGLYVRQSSGLIREFRPADVFVFNTLGYALGLVLAVVPTFMAGLWPEQNVLLVVAIGTVLTLSNALMYGYLAGVMPARGATTSTSHVSSTRRSGSRPTGASRGRSSSDSGSTRPSP